jgi:hypothetical protein
MLCGHGAARFTVGAFRFSEYTFSESRRALDGFPHAANFDNVDTDGDDHKRF